MSIITELNPYTAAIKIGAVVVLAVGSYFYGSHVENLSWSAKWNATVAAQEQEAKLAEASYREREQAYAQQMAEKDKQLLETQDENKRRVAAILLQYNNSNLRLRKRFTCPTGGVSQANTSTGSSDAASKGGLQKPDVEFLIRLAGQCDEVVNQLAACQAVVSSYKVLEGK